MIMHLLRLLTIGSSNHKNLKTYVSVCFFKISDVCEFQVIEFFNKVMFNDSSTLFVFYAFISFNLLLKALSKLWSLIRI